MKRVKFLVMSLVTALSVAACASNAAPNQSIATAKVVGEEPQPRWSGNIRASVTDRLSGDSTRERMGGSLVWTPGATPSLSRASLEFSYSGSARELTWGIYYGPCGNASLPIVTLSDFPELEMSSGGRTQVVASISAELPTTGAFHVEIFKDRSGDPEYSIACGNLKFTRG